jgi:hypothetical protein
MLSLNKSKKIISDIFTPKKFIFSPEELSSEYRLTADAREEAKKKAREDRLLELLSYLQANDSDRQVHLYDRQQSTILGHTDGLQHYAKPTTSEESQG